MDEPKLGRRAIIALCSYFAIVSGILGWMLWALADAAF